MYMIAALTGNAIHRTEKYCIIDVSGVGYKVYATQDTMEYAENTPEVFLFVHTVVREDALELYGFRDESSLSLFEKLISISGIGPRGALGALSVAPIENLRTAIIAADISYLTKVSGIGKKIAEKIILELRDSIGASISAEQSSAKDDSDVIAALESLGFSTSDARSSLKLISKDTVGTDNKIKEALRLLAQ
jgi:holliday junction DNA helicase RuvA